MCVCGFFLQPGHLRALVLMLSLPCVVFCTPTCPVPQVVRADVMKDASGRSKGCGIVEYRTPVEAQEAINTLLDTELKGRLIFVREDREAAGISHVVSLMLLNS